MLMMMSGSSEGRSEKNGCLHDRKVYELDSTTVL